MLSYKSVSGYRLSLLFSLFLMCSQIEVAICLSRFGLDDKVSSASVPTTVKTMKKPCVMYRVEYLKYFNQTNKDDIRDESTWVCELDAEDRVS